jgi:hypothetical protein
VTTSEEECVEAIEEAAERLGESPTKAQYEELGLTPSASTILRVVGGWNEAKTRAGLEVTPGRGSRVAPQPDHVDLPEETDWSALSQDQRWHYRNPDWNTERTLERRRRTRRWLAGEKRRRGGCRDCETIDPPCLDVHHIDPEGKTMAVNKMVLYGYSRSRIQDELASCVVLCANCHRLRHNEPVETDTTDGKPSFQSREPPSTRAEIRQWTQSVRAASGCEECGCTDPRCLMFHHVDPSTKTASVAAMITNGRPFPEVRSEVEKCVVLCANCHRKRHHQTRTRVSESDSV